MREAPGPLVTRDILQLTVQEFRSDLHRALWILGVAIVAAVGAMAAAAVAVLATIA